MPDHVGRLARSDATVLVTGETGSGKEFATRRIRATSGRPGSCKSIALDVRRAAATHIDVACAVAAHHCRTALRDRSA